MFINFSRLDQTSFWIGFIAASLLWMIISIFRPTLKQIRQKLRENYKVFKSKTVSLVEEHYCAFVHLQAQRMHLASSLFPLSDLAIEPKLMAPPRRVTPDEPFSHNKPITDVIPYLPSWPELGSLFGSSSISITKALLTNIDIVLTGQPGSGKTFTLAYIALQLTKIKPNRTKHNLEENKIPFLIHIADLDLESNHEEDPLNQIIEFISSKSQISDLPRIPKFINNVFSSGRALLLLDGTDELSPDKLTPVIRFIKYLKLKYPLTQIITTGIPENLQGLVTLNFLPLTLDGWKKSDYKDFLTTWGHLWSKYIGTEFWVSSPSIDPLLLNNWIFSTKKFFTPFELTLLAWGCYGGDSSSGDFIDALGAHINRLNPDQTPIEALEILALQVYTSDDLSFELRKAREWIKSFETTDISPNSPNEKNLEPQDNLKKSLKLFNNKTSKIPSLGIIAKFVESGLLISHNNNIMRFIHPIIGGYLAGRVLGNLKIDDVINLPNWSGKYLAMHYFAAQKTADDLAYKIMSIPDRLLERNILLVARWMRDTKLETKWRSQAMEKLVSLLMNPENPLGFRGQVLAAILLADDPSAALLFRQMLASEDPELLQLCMLGCASFKDTKAINGIAKLLASTNANVLQVAFLSLVKIGTPLALDHVASVLLHGDEDSRTIAAKALAIHSEIGHSMLKEGATMDDLMVRRAVVFGLGDVDEPWAWEILMKLQIEDDQWIVRNAVTEVIENKELIERKIPKRLPPPSECPWLVAFAAKKGVGISPDSQAIDILLLALTEGSELEQLASLDYLRVYPSIKVFEVLFRLLYGNNSELREAVFRVLWEMGSRGVVIPDPQQLGVIK